ncbi:hypothetical protein KSF78_0004640 [Schistosoma japonicum]|nr:hypothetical protein KSF78_0004640 [Schistosoma japonicum]
MSSSSSSSLLYMIALLLVLIHSSIQSGFPNDVFTSLSKQISEVQDHINFYAKPLVTSYRYLEIITDVSCLKRSRSETFPKYFFIDRNSLYTLIQSQRKAIFFINVLAMKFTLFSNVAKLNKTRYLDNK